MSHIKPRVWGWTDSLQQQLNIQVVNSVFWGRMKQVSTLLSKPAALYRTLPGARVHLVASSPWSASIYCRNVPFWSQAPCTCVYPVNPRSAEWSLDDGRMMHWPMTASAADGRLTLQKTQSDKHHREPNDTLTMHKSIRAKAHIQ